MKITTTILAIAFLMASCHEYDKTKSGLAYKITKGKGKEKLQQGEFIKFNLEYKIGGKDSVLNTTYGHIPAYVRIDTNTFSKHNFTEVLMQCGEGDKIDFIMSVDTLKKLGIIPEYNPVFTRRGTIKGKVEILQVFKTDAELNTDYQKESEIERNNEVKQLEKYASEKKFKTEKSKNGVLVVVENAGDALKADSGKQVSVFYKGYLENGKTFDTNKDSANGSPKPPYTFIVGKRSVIQGWDESLKFFGKGGKGKLLVPAMLAYGPQGSQPVIPPFANLIFEVQITDVTDAPAAPLAPAPPAIK